MLEKLKLAENALARMVERPGGALAEDYQAARAVLADIRGVIDEAEERELSAEIWASMPKQGPVIGPVTHIEGDE